MIEFVVKEERVEEEEVFIVSGVSSEAVRDVGVVNNPRLVRMVFKILEDSVFVVDNVFASVFCDVVL